MASQEKTSVVGYARVSTEEQALGGVSLHAQRAKIEDYASRQGLHLVGIVSDEGASGKATVNRPGLAKVRQILEAGEAEGLVVLKLDRLSRSTRDILDLVDECARRTWSLHSIAEQIDTETANGRFVLTVLAGLSQMEREQIGERTRLALAYKKAKGERVGAIPYGWSLGEDGKTLKESPTEQAVLGLIGELRASGLSLRAIVARLNNTKVPSRGNRWHLTSVARILKELRTAG